MNVAICPCLSKDGRLVFEVPGSAIWRLTGKLVEDGEDAFIFQCDDTIMGTRGGIYHFYVLDIETMKNTAKNWISHGDEICKKCSSTEELHDWYRTYYPPNHLTEMQI